MDVKELEAKLEQIDQQSELASVKVDLEGSTEAAAHLNVTVTKSIGLESETLLDIDLADVDVPDAYIQEKIDAAFRKGGLEGLGELAGVKVMQKGATADYEVVEDYTYKSTEQGFSITALKGFVYDRSSVPRIFWVIIDKDDLSNVPPLFHDLLYRNVGVLPNNQVTPFRTFQRNEADDLFLELMKKTGVKSWRARLAHQAVSRFGGFAWKQH